MKVLLRNLIARLPGIRFWIARWLFLRPEQQHNVHRFWGVFRTQAEAKAHVPSGWNQGLDDPIPETIDEAIPERDAEVVRILARLMPEVKTVFDLGGRTGFSFYRYRSQIPYPPDLRWTVCDLPDVNEVGRRIALRRGETQLVFTGNPLDGDGADVYLTCGALQFFEESFAELLQRLKSKPRHLLVNRVPLTEKSEFFTLQHTTGRSIVPYHIDNIDRFISAVEALGYKLVERWANDRTCEIILRPDRFVRHYYGFYFVLG